MLDHLKTLRSLCLVLGMDFNQTACEIHSSLGGAEASSFSSETIDSLASAIQRLREIKTQRLQAVSFIFPAQHFHLFGYPYVPLLIC